MTMKAKTYFGVADIAVFAVTLVLATLVGVYYAYTDRKKKTLKNYYYGGKKMDPVPLGLSMGVTFISAITVMAYPGDTYIYGMIVMWYGFTTIVPTWFACLYYIPFAHRHQFNTIYQFLELRFHRRLRLLSSGIELFNQTLYMGFTIYLPSLALNAVTPLKLTWTIALTGGICTFYTVVGGMKAVVWTDTLQSVILLTGVIATLVKGCILVGGFGPVWEALERGGRLNMWDFDPNPTLKTTVWTLLVGMGCSQATLLCVNQSIHQRYLSCDSIKKARLASFVALVPKMAVGAMVVLGGCVAYTYFEGCDPLKTGEISKTDQIMPYFVLKLFYDLPGLAGFYVAAIYSGTLSTVSSGINSLAAMLLQDFIVPSRREMKSSQKFTLSKFLVLGLGVTVTAVAYLASALGATVVKMVFIIRGSCGGPIMGVFTLGMFLPWANSKGAFVGQIIGTLVSFWLALGNYIYGISPESKRMLPTSTLNCSIQGDEINNSTRLSFNNFTESPLSHTSALVTEAEQTYPAVYSMSYLYYSCIGLTTTILIGLLVSFITGPNNPHNYEPSYFLPMVDNKLLPEKVRSFFRFGVSEFKESENKLELEEMEEKEELFHSNNNVGN